MRSFNLASFLSIAGDSADTSFLMGYPVLRKKIF